MNILYIHTHDSGRFIQPYGHAIPTPHLMQLAKEGVLFRKCFSCAPTCSPSRAALLTGMNPHSAGMLGLAHRGFSLTNPRQHLAHHLKANGYETVLCGMQHVIEHGKEQSLGYSSVLQSKDPDEGVNGIYWDMEKDAANASAAAEYLSQPKTQSFFLSFGMVSTHFPLPEPARDINPSYLQPPPSLPDTPEIRKDMAGYQTLARHADHCVGMVLEALKKNKLEKDTLVIFTTDHGIAFPWMKCNLFDHGIGVSLILRFPGNAFSGQVVDALVSHVDIFPTLCELTETQPPGWLEGTSLLPLVHGETDQVREEIFGEVTYHAAYEPMRCIRTKRFKYIRYFDDFQNVIRPNIDNSRSKRFLMEHGLDDRGHFPSEMLFDLYFDPNERDNLADQENYAPIKTKLANKLHNWMVDTDDPLTDGPVSLPPNGYANPKEDIHPS